MQAELRLSYGSDCLLGCDIEAQQKHIHPFPKSVKTDRSFLIGEEECEQCTTKRNLIISSDLQQWRGLLLERISYRIEDNSITSSNF